ncbi:MAG: AMP-binding protein [Polyangiaceae bacterium]
MSRAVIVGAEGEKLDDADIHRVACGLLRWRHDEDVPPSTPVAFEVDRSAVGCAMVLAALQRRVSFLPLHPAWGPDDRRARIAAAGAVELDRERVRTWLQEGGTFVEATSTDAPASVTLFTSGTTGEPRPVVLSFDAFRASAEATRSRLGDRHAPAITTLPLAHVGGLSVLTRAHHEGTPVVVVPHGDVASLVDATVRHGVRRWSIVPATLFDLLTSTTGTGRLRDHGGLDAVVVGGGPVDPDLVREARARGIPVRTTYGLTETASQVALQDAIDAAHDDGNVGRALEGSSIDVVDDDGIEVRAGTTGRIRVSGPTVACRVGGANTRNGAGVRRIVTQDEGWLDEHGRLHVVGRRDDVVIVSGYKVHPRNVEVALTGVVPGAHVVAFGIADARRGGAVALLVVGRAVPPDACERLHHAATTTLPTSARPTRYMLEREWPTWAGPPHKPRRAELSLRYSDIGRPQAAPRAQEDSPWT